MKVQAITPILNVSNLKESFEWFEQFGWKKLWEWGDPPTFGAIASGDNEIFLCQNCQGARGGPMPQEPWDNQAGSTWMSWFVESKAEVDAMYELALKLGVVAPWPPTGMPWGVYECHIRHPDGHMFRVGASSEDE